MQEYYYRKSNREKWNGFVSEVSECGWLHSWDAIRYGCKFNQIIDNSSFIMLDNKDIPLSVCILAAYVNDKNEAFLSFGGLACAIPAFSKLIKSRRRKVEKIVFSIILDYCKKYNIQSITLSQPAVNIEESINKHIFANKKFLLQKYNFIPHVINTSIITLSQDNQELYSNVSQSHSKLIKRAKKNGLEVEVVNKQAYDNEKKIVETLYEFQDVHLQAAGRKTRPQSTWDAMKDALVAGMASLFVAHTEFNQPISYLFCGEFCKSAFGWSQANVPEYEKKISPRHLLEWKAIEYYKQNGFSFYEIGEIFYSRQLFSSPTEKEKSISVFKERYGGDLFPKITWKGFIKDEIKQKLLRAEFVKFEQELKCFQM